MVGRAGYKKTDAGLIPDNWDCIKLGDFIRLQRGHDLTWRDRRPGVVPVMGSAGKNGYHDTALAKGPGVVLGRSGASFGQAHYCEQDFWPHNTALYVTDFRDNDPLFVFFFLKSIDFSRHNSGGAQQSLNRNFIAPIIVGVPRPPEQCAIAAALADVDKLLAGLDRLIAKNLDLKKATIQQLLRGKTRLPGFSGEWGRLPLSGMANLNRVNVVPADFPDELFTHFSLPAFDAAKVAPVEFGMEIGSNKFRVPSNAVLVSKLNPRIPRIWTPLEIPANAVASTEWLVLTPNERTDRNFLHVICSSPDFCSQMELGATGTTGSHQRINPATAMGITAVLPIEKSEQAAIAEVLMDMDIELERLEMRRHKTDALRQAIMHELITGNMRLV